jgi:TonB-linked SusC/RagA family outer membrane protein
MKKKLYSDRNRKFSGLIKLLKVMKLTVLLLLVSVFGVLANKSYSQNKMLNLSMQNATVKEVLNSIEKQSEFYFLYSENLIDVKRKIDITLVNQKIDQALKLIFKGTDVDYSVRDRIIVLTPQEIFKRDLEVLAQQKSVSGTVTDSGGQPLPGVTVVVKGTTQGTVTDTDGNYSLTNIPEGGTLVFSFVGMRMQEVEVGDQTTINVTIEEEAIGIEEVVAIGYGSKKKINVTGAVDVISNEQLKNRSNTSVSQLLGTTAIGVSMDIDNNGYQPGAEGDISLRGIGSLNGGSPYVVIDGFAGDMNRLNPEDIESITILKDAGASAIYGARAAYGVILITTKSGKKNKKLTASYNGSMNLVTPARLPGTLDSYTFARVINEANLNKSSNLTYDEQYVENIIAYQDGDYAALAAQFPAGFPMDKVTNWECIPNENGGWGTSVGNIDPWDFFTGPNLGSTHSFAIEGGSEKTAYFFSLGYLDQASSLRFGDDTFKRFNVSAKINTELTDWWDFRYETRFMKSNRHLPSGSRPDQQDTYNALFHIIFNTPPTQAMYNNFGGKIQGMRQFFDEGGYNNDERTENWQIFATELRPAKGWKINADFAYQSIDQYDIHDGQDFAGTNWITGEKTSSWFASRVYEYHQSNYYMSANAYTTYEFSLNENHNFLLMGGTQFETGTYRSLNANANHLMVNDVISLSTTTGEKSISEGLTHWATEGYFGRLSYNYKEKYLFESNVRYDGTSKFIEGNRWGFFPSFSAGWTVSKENFWEPVAPVINSLKIRGSWGELGNQNVSAYQDLALISMSTNILGWLPGNGETGQVGYTNTPGLVSPVLTWETAATTNLGLNMGLLDHKLQVDFDWFERNTSNMIGPVEDYPGVLGASAPRSNNAELRTRGFELAVRWKQSLANGLNYYVNMNVYDATSVVTKYHNPTGTLNSWREGQEVGEIWGWSSGGMFKTQEEIDNHADQSYIYNIWNTGDLKYDDINGDGKIDKGANTIDDPGDQILLGNSEPHYQFGINAGLDYKGFDFSMTWKGTAKREKGLLAHRDYGYFGFLRAGWSQPKDDHLDYYRDQPGTKYVGLHEGEANINTDSYYTRPYLDSNSSAKNYNSNSWFLPDYSYIRLQNVQLGYTFPKSVISKIGIQKLRIYLSGDNLLTLDHLPKGLDPTSSGGGYYDCTGKDYRADRIYSMGINITL